DDALNTARIVRHDGRDVGASGHLRHLHHVHLLELFAKRRHLQDGSPIGHAALLAPGVAVDFVVQHDRRKAFFSEPGMEDLLEADVRRSAVTRHYDDVLRLIPEPQPKATRQAARNTILIAIVTVHEGIAGLRNARTTTPGGADRNGVFWVGEGDHGEANKEGHRTTGAHGMLFEDFLEAPICDTDTFLPKGPCST